MILHGLQHRQGSAKAFFHRGKPGGEVYGPQASRHLYAKIQADMLSG
jgi:hypothetical protein